MPNCGRRYAESLRGVLRLRISVVELPGTCGRIVLVYGRSLPELTSRDDRCASRAETREHSHVSYDTMAATSTAADAPPRSAERMGMRRVASGRVRSMMLASSR